MTTRRWLLRLLQLVLLIAVAYGLYRALSDQLSQITWARVRELGTPAAGTLALSTALLLAVYLLHALLWRRITREIGGGDAPLRPALHAYFVSGLARYLPLRFLQLAGLAVLSARAGLAPSRAMAASVLGQLGFLTTGFLFLGLTLPDLAETLGRDNPAATLNPFMLAGVLVVLAAAGIWVLVATRAGHGFHAWVGRRFGERMGERVGATLAIADEVQPGRALLWAAGYALSWLMLGAAFVLFVQAFVPLDAEHVVKTAGAVAASYLAGYLFFLTPAGIGIRESAMVLLLAQYLPPAAALVIGVLSRVWFTLAELLPLALIPLLPRTSGLSKPAGVT